MKELIGARTAEINELPSAAFDVFLTPDSAFDIDRMIKKHGTKKTSEIFDSIFVGNYPYSSKFFKTLIEKLMVKMKKQEFILLLRSGDIEYIADLFSDIYDALDSCGIYDTFYIGPNMNRLPIKKRSSLIVDALAIMPTPAPQQTLKTNNINANILYKTI